MSRERAIRGFGAVVLLEQIVQEMRGAVEPAAFDHEAIRHIAPPRAGELFIQPAAALDDLAEGLLYITLANQFHAHFLYLFPSQPAVCSGKPTLHGSSRRMCSLSRARLW